jgi:hypothetical protein
LNSISSPKSSGLAFFVSRATTVAESLVFWNNLVVDVPQSHVLAIVRQFPNDVSILAIARVKVLDSRKRCFRDVGVVSAKKITVVVDDIGTIIQSPHPHILLAVQRNPVPEELFLALSEWNPM